MSIQSKLDIFIGDAARATKYRLHLPVPQTISYNISGDSLDLVCKSANIPAKALDTIILKHKGRDIPVPGQEKFNQTFDLTFYLDPNHNIKKMFEDWITALDADSYQKTTPYDVSNARVERDNNIGALKVDLIIQQLDFNELDTSSKYVFRYAFPTNISEIAYGSDKIGELLEFTVTFTFTFFETGDYTTFIKPKTIINTKRGLYEMPVPPDILSKYKSVTERNNKP